MVHPLRVRTMQGAGVTRKGGFWPMLAASALGGILPSIVERILPRGNGMRRGMMKRKGGLAAPYGGSKCGGRKMKRAGAQFTPGPLA